MIAGLDEAGRGPVIGPLVVAGVAGPDDATFRRMGCRDSKALSVDRRLALDRALRAHPTLRFALRVIEPETIDAERQAGVGLNEIEIRRFREIAADLQAAGAAAFWVDAADVDAARFGHAVAQALHPPMPVVSEHKADDKFPVVGAASILAKVERDRRVAELGRRLERRLGLPLGSGYPSDEVTMTFLRAWHQRFGDLPEGTRRTWETAKELLRPRAAKLTDF